MSLFDTRWNKLRSEMCWASLGMSLLAPRIEMKEEEGAWIKLVYSVGFRSGILKSLVKDSFMPHKLEEVQDNNLREVRFSLNRRQFIYYYYLLL